MTSTYGGRVSLPPIMFGGVMAGKETKATRKAIAIKAQGESSALPGYGKALSEAYPKGLPTLEKYRKLYITAGTANTINTPRTKLMTVDQWEPKSCAATSRGRDFKEELYSEVNAKGADGGFLVDTFPKVGDLRRFDLVAHRDVPIVSMFTKIADHKVEGWELKEDGRKDHWFNFTTPIYKNRHKSDLTVNIGGSDIPIKLARLSSDPKNDSDWFFTRDDHKYIWRQSTQDSEDLILTRAPQSGEGADENEPEVTIATFYGLTKKKKRSEGMLEFMDYGPDGPYVTVEMKKEALGTLLFVLEMLGRR